ncbi:MAG TPA: hypothetical protein VHD90_04465, partial [Phototrophicaceae bacterium]|nr:hypothetical protein [Phototrophicaceae bacterium]
MFVYRMVARSRLMIILCLMFALITVHVVSIRAAGGSSYSTTFESPTFSTGSVDGQDNWRVGSASYDQAVVTDSSFISYSSFG